MILTYNYILTTLLLIISYSLNLYFSFIQYFVYISAHISYLQSLLLICYTATIITFRFPITFTYYYCHITYIYALCNVDYLLSVFIQCIIENLSMLASITNYLLCVSKRSKLLYSYILDRMLHL